MANETTSPNMNLPVPGVSLTSGPTWATDLNNCLSLIDSHTHTSGSGVPITPSAININSDLLFGSNNATQIRAARFSPQGSPIAATGVELTELYVSGVDLYYNDGSGNQVRITQSGGVAGSPGSISNLTSPASAAYVAANGKFVWQQDTNTSADMDFGSAIMRNDSASSFALTLSPPALGANYSITLPSLPASQKFMTLDSSGNMAAPWAVDNSTLEIASGTTVQVKDAGITNAKMAALSVGTTNLINNAVTPAKQATLNSTLTSSCSNYTRTSTSYGTVTNMSGSITTRGAPVSISFVYDQSGSGQARLGASAPSFLEYQILRGATVIAWGLFGTNSGALPYNAPTSTINTVDNPGAGTYTYALQVKSTSGDSVSFQYSKMFLQEQAGGI